MVHTRQLDGQTLTFIVSGKLWRNSLVMRDKETNSLWSHVTGVCLEGELTGQTLTQIPSVQTTWAEWQQAHLDTRVLKKSEEITSSHYESYFKDPAKTGFFRTVWLQDRLPGKSLVHGITLGPHALAVTNAALEPGAKLAYELGGVKLNITRDADGGVRASRATAGTAVLVRTAYWFAWSTFYPNTEVLD